MALPPELAAMAAKIQTEIDAMTPEERAAWTLRLEHEIFEREGIEVQEPERALPSACTLGRWHAVDANGDNLDCGSVHMIVEGNRPDGNYPGLVAGVRLVIRD